MEDNEQHEWWECEFSVITYIGLRPIRLGITMSTPHEFPNRGSYYNRSSYSRAIYESSLLIKIQVKINDLISFHSKNFHYYENVEVDKFWAAASPKSGRTTFFSYVLITSNREMRYQTGWTGVNSNWHSTQTARIWRSDVNKATSHKVKAKAEISHRT